MTLPAARRERMQRTNVARLANFHRAKRLGWRFRSRYSVDAGWQFFAVLEHGAQTELGPFASRHEAVDASLEHRR